MKRVLPLLLLMTSLAAPSAHAALKTITLDVPGMTCSACPITVKKALLKVRGVTDAKVTYKRKEAIVTYDDSATNTAALMKATADVGYPSKIKAAK